MAFIEQQTGTPTPPIDFQAMANATPQTLQRLSVQLMDRFNRLDGGRRQFGNRLSRNPWTPAEAEGMAALMRVASDEQRLAFYGMLQGGTNNVADYAAALKPLAADKPVLMLAGLASYRQFRDPKGQAVAPLILSGSRVLADKTQAQPAEDLFQAAFTKAIGNAIPHGTTERAQAYVGFKAIYAGIAARDGVAFDPKFPQLNFSVAENAMNLATGGVSEIHGKKVIRPWGQTDAEFREAYAGAVKRLATQQELDADDLDNLPLEPVPTTEREFYLIEGGKRKADPKTGQFLRIVL